MKKLFTVSLLGVLLSIPSVVFAEASWYGSIRTGVESNDSNNTGVADFGSRWGIQGSSEVSEGLSAVYRYERKIDSTDASDPGGRLSYVGLSGGFGTITVGQVWGAAYNHFGGIVDQALNYGSPGTTGYRFADTLSYAVSVGNVSLQVDAVMDQSTGKTGDGYNVGATLGGLMETGSIAIAHRKHQDTATAAVEAAVADARNPEQEAARATDVEQSSSFIAGSYGIGDMTIFLGYSQSTADDAGCNTALITALGDECGGRRVKSKITYAGVHGGVGDTGVNYVFTMRNQKVDSSGFGTNDANDDGDLDDEDTIATSDSGKNNPWTLGLSRSLGGGAQLRFEHSEPDTDADSTTAVWLHINF